MRLGSVSAAAAAAATGVLLLTAAPAQAVPTRPCFDAAGTGNGLSNEGASLSWQY